MTLFDIQRPCPDAVLKLFDLAAQVFKTLRLDSHLHRAAVGARDPQRYHSDSPQVFYHHGCNCAVRFGERLVAGLPPGFPLTPGLNRVT